MPEIERSSMTDDAQLAKIMRQVQAMLDKAAHTEHPAERDAFAAKAQALMTKYHLTTVALERESGKTTGKREEQKVRGGFYLWQRRLWASVADLNFCLHWIQEKWFDKPSLSCGGRFRRVHCLVGRQVNVQNTITMSQYLQQTIDRAVNVFIHNNHNLFLSREANAFREGMSDALVMKVSEKFKRKLADEKRRKQAPKRPESGFGTSLALLDAVEQETAGNYDFLHGEGAYARQKAQEAEIAKEEAEAEAAYTAWAAANPEEARRRAEEEDKIARRWRGRSQRRKIKHFDTYSYYKGHDAAENVNLDTQIDKEKIAGRIGHAKS